VLPGLFGPFSGWHQPTIALDLSTARLVSVVRFRPWPLFKISTLG